MSIEQKNIRAALRELRDKSNKRNFNQSIDLIINLCDIDMKKPEGRIQETIELPNAVDKKVNICVFATGDIALRAKKTGIDLVLGNTEIESLMTDKKRQRQMANNIDSFISVTSLMPLVGRSLGSILGPRGKMPTPVSPTANIENEIEKHKRTISVRTRGQPVLHCRVGTETMSDEKVSENIQAVLRRITGKLRKGIKNIDSVYVKMTMGPSTKIKM